MTNERRVIEIDDAVPASPRREVIVRPGYDCIRNPCGKNGCGKSPGAGHGIHCDEWVYLVRGDEGDCTLSLLVFSGVWPVTVPTAALGTIAFPRGADISLHCSFPTGDDDDAGRECEWVRGGRCWLYGSTSLGAMDFMKEFFVMEHGKDQREPFWRAMEDRFTESAGPVRRRLN